MKMNLFALAGLSLSISCLLLAAIVYINSRRKLNLLWALFNISVAIFGLGSFLVGIANNYEDALLGWRIFWFGLAFISVFFYHLILIFCEYKETTLLIIAYSQAVVFALLALFTNQMTEGTLRLFGFYYAKANLVNTIFLCIWTGISVVSFIKLYRYKLVSKGVKRPQSSYLFYGMMLGFISGSTTALPCYGINIYPAWHFLICIYAVICTYAILKYRLMDIRLVISNTAIFIVVYALVLGVPFYLYAIGFKFTALVVMLVLATAGPFMLFYLQRRAGDRLLQEQRRYQATLRQASAGMGKIKDLKKLLNMTVSVLTNAVQIEHTLIYIYNGGQKQYVLGASERKSGHNSFVHNIEEKSSLVQHLLNNKNPVILEEIKQRAEDSQDLQLLQIAKIISSLEGALVVPIFINENLAAIIIMGKKESGKLYSEDDLAVFSILANQTALAIENAKFFEDIKLTQEQLFQAEKMATIGTMADGLSHQINNRFHALGFIAGDALDTIHLTEKEPMPDKMKEVMTELGRAFARVQDNVVQGGEIVRGLLRYTRKGEAGLAAVDIDAAFQSGLEMAQFKIKTGELKIIRDYDSQTIPKIKGNFTQLQEVFFNLIDNGYDAMMQRKNEKKEPDYQPTLIVRVFKEDDSVQIILEDNGIGVKEEDMYKLFTPFFTTKLSSKKGTGLGLYVIKKIVEDNHGGQVEMVSKYMQGTQMKLRLPVAIG